MLVILSALVCALMKQIAMKGQALLLKLGAIGTIVAFKKWLILCIKDI